MSSSRQAACCHDTNRRGGCIRISRGQNQPSNGDQARFVSHVMSVSVVMLDMSSTYSPAGTACCYLVDTYRQAPRKTQDGFALRAWRSHLHLTWAYSLRMNCGKLRLRSASLRSRLRVGFRRFVFICGEMIKPDGLNPPVGIRLSPLPEMVWYFNIRPEGRTVVQVG